MNEETKDYLTEYRQFFERFDSTVDPNDQLPVKLASYNLAKFEIPGEVIDWCLQYLNERRCPSSLLVPLCQIVVEELTQECDKHPESFGYRSAEDDYLSLHLMQDAIRKLVEVCRRYKDNAKLCTLPPPPPSGTLLGAKVSACAIKNCRRTMEDRHVAIQDLHALFNIKGGGSASYYGVFDGHSGVDAASYSVSHLHQFLVESPNYPENPDLALKDAFRKTDDSFKDKSHKENLKSGTTAVCALLRPNESMLYVAWLGDSQAMLVTQGKPYQLVKPHKPDQPEEKERIEEMGGSVIYWGTWRVNGLLAVSRAIGDVDYKPFVSGEPDVRVIPLTGQEEYLVLACDGLWDFMNEVEVRDTIESFLADHPEDIRGVSERLVQVCKAQGSNDNISVLVVFLKEPAGGGGMETSVHPTAELFAKANGGQRPPPAAAAPFGPEDFGPETDVDAPDDPHLILSPSLTAAKAIAPNAPLPGSGGEVWVPHKKLQAKEESWLMTLPWSYADAVRKKPKPKEEPPAPTPPPPQPPPPKVEELVSDVVEGEAVESEDDSDGEWNYIKGEDKEIEQKPDEELSESDMESRLNPNAAEFVPSLPLDPVIASSPKKGSEVSMENVRIPALKDFLDEISHRPAELECTGNAENDPKNQKDEFDLLFNKIESKEEIGVSDAPPQKVMEEEKLSSPKVETNPFLGHDDKENDPFYMENERTDFFKDHFAAPSEESTDQQVTSSILEDHAQSPNTELGSLHSDLVKNFNGDNNVQVADADSPYDFVFNGEKSDLGSPVDQLINAEPNSSSGFDSGSNEEIETNSQSKLISDGGIMFGDGVDIDEIRKLKLDSPEEKITIEDNRDLVEEIPVFPSDDTLILESATQEVLSPIINLENSVPGHFDDLISSEELGKKDEESEHLESPIEEEFKHQEEVVDTLPKEEIVVETIPLEAPVDIPNEVPLTENNDTNLTVNFIQELQFNDTVKVEESQKRNGYLELSESELEASFEIISHEATKELDSEMIAAKESLPVDEKSLLDQNEIEKEEGVLEARPDSVVGDLLDQIVSSKQEISDILKQEATFERMENISENERLVKDDLRIIEPAAVPKDSAELLEDFNNERIIDEITNHQITGGEALLEVSSGKIAGNDHSEVMLEEKISLEIKQPELSETSQPVDVSAATPPPTPALGSDDKHDLAAAAFGALGTAALVAGTASLLENEIHAGGTDVEKVTTEGEPAILKSEETEVEKSVDLKKPQTSTTPKKPSPVKTASPTASKPLSKPTAKATTSSVPPKKPTTVSSTKPLQSKPVGSAKPSTPTSTKPSTPTTTKPATPTASKPTTPTTAKPTTTATKMVSKPLSKPTTPVNKSAPSVPSKAAPKPATQASSKPKTSEASSKPAPKATGSTSASVTAKPKPSAPVAPKAAPIAKTGVDKAPVKKDEPLVKKAVPAAKPSAAKPPAATKVTSTTRPGSAGTSKATSTTAPSKAPPKAAPATKPVAAKPPVTSTTKSAPSASSKPPLKATAPAPKPVPATQAKPKVPAATNKAKPVAKGAPNDKSVKDAANNKLTAKSVPKKVDPKAVKDVPEKKIINEDKASELVTQENSVSTTNGHLDIIENGIQNGNSDSPIDNPHLEIIEAQLV